MIRANILAIFIFCVSFVTFGQNPSPVQEHNLPVFQINVPDDSIMNTLFEILYDTDINFQMDEGQYAFSHTNNFEFSDASVSSLIPHFSTNYMNGIEIYAEGGFKDIFGPQPKCKTIEIYSFHKASPFFTRLLIRNILDNSLPGPTLNNSELAVLYINGTYAGPVLVQEGQDDFMQNFYPGKDSGITSFHSNNEIEQIPKEYKELMSFLSFNDLSDNINFRTTKQMIDLAFFNKLLFLSIYSADPVWENNVNIFRAADEGFIWRFSPCGMQKGFAFDENSQSDLNLLENYTTNSTDENIGPVAFFNKLLRNEDYFHEILSGFYTNCAINIDTASVLPVFDSISKRISKEYTLFLNQKDNFPVFVDSLYFTSSEEFETDLSKIRDFLSQRPEYMKKHILQVFGGDILNFKLININQDSGSIFINNTFLEDSIYKKDLVPGSKVSLQAQSNSTFYFSHWSGLPGGYNSKSSIELEFTEGLTVTPVFESAPEVVINEIHYNAKEGKLYDYLELFNPLDVPTDISKYYFESGFIDFTFPKNTIIPPKGYLVIAKDTSKYSPCNCQLFQLEYDGLSDFGELFRLNRTDNTIVDEVEYFTTPPWPTEANGQGPSLELSSFNTNNSLAGNWKASSIDGGTPGYENSERSYLGIIINEIAMDNKSDIFDMNYEYDTWVELKNNSNDIIDFDGLFLSNKGEQLNMFQLKPQNSSPQNTIIYPGEYFILWTDSNSTQGPFHTNFTLNRNDTLYLSNGRELVFDKMIIPDAGDFASVGIYPDGEGELFSFYDATPGVENSIAPVILSVPIDTVTEGSSWLYLFETVDKDDDPIQIQYWQVPAWLNYEENGGNISFSGTPDSLWLGANKVKISVTDGFTKPVFHEFNIDVLKFIEPIDTIPDNDTIPGNDTVPPIDTIPDIDTLPGTDTIPDSLPDNIQHTTSGPFIAPNIVENFIVIEKTVPEGFLLYIYDIKGILRKQKHIHSGLSRHIVNVSDLTNGLYIVVIKAQNKIFKQKIVKIEK